MGASTSPGRREKLSWRAPTPAPRSLMRAPSQPPSLESTSSSTTVLWRQALAARRTTCYIKDYMKKVVKYLEDNKREEEVPEFKKKINDTMKDLLPKFKDLKFFQGEGMDPNAMIMILDYKEVNGEEKPVLMAFRHGVNKEKC